MWISAILLQKYSRFQGQGLCLLLVCMKSASEQLLKKASARGTSCIFCMVGKPGSYCSTCPTCVFDPGGYSAPVWLHCSLQCLRSAWQTRTLGQFNGRDASLKRTVMQVLCRPHTFDVAVTTYDLIKSPEIGKSLSRNITWCAQTRILLILSFTCLSRTALPGVSVVAARSCLLLALLSSVEAGRHGI